MRHSISLLVVFSVPLWGQPVSLADFFDETKIQEIRISIAAADWQALKEHYLENTYYPCDLTWNGIALPNIGIRSRGSSSRSPIKPALGFDFTKYVKTQRFLDLKALVLRNLGQDASMMHEFLAEKLFERMGLPHSREVYVKLLINNVYSGLYLAVEPFDDRYTSSHFGETNGYLYEMQGQTDYHFEFLGDDPSAYIPKYFDSKLSGSDDTKLVAWIKAMNQVSDAAFAFELAKYMDLSAFVTHVAVEQFLGDWDAILSDTGMTNFYVYRRSNDGRWVFLPWDKEMALSANDRTIWQNSDGNLLMRRALAVPGMRNRFLEAVWQASEVAGPDGNWLLHNIDRTFALIEQAGRDDPHRLCIISAELRPCDWQTTIDAVEYLRYVAATRPAIVRAEASLGGFQATSPGLHLSAGDAISPASQTSRLVPGSLAILFADRLTEDAVLAGSTPLPRDLAGVMLFVADTPAPLLAVTPDRVIFEVPADASYGPVALRISTGADPDSRLYAEVYPSAAGIYGIAHQDGAIVDAAAPARPGEYLSVWGSGFGGVTGLPSGVAGPLGPLHSLALPLSATLGSSTVQVVWAGAAPGLVGVQQIVLHLPDSISGASSSSMPLQFLQNGESSSPFPLAVER